MMEEVFLGDYIELIGGGTPSKEVSSYWNGDIPWVSVKDLKSDYITNTDEFISEEGVCRSATNVIPKDTLIIATRMAVGKVAFPKMDVAINQDLKAVKCKADLNKKFLFYFLKSKSKYFDSVSSGATVKGIKINHIKEIKIPLPPLETQKKIAAILDEADKLRQLNRQLIEKYDALTQSLFLEMFGDPKTFRHYPISEIASKEKYSLSSGPFGSNLTSKHYTNDGIIVLRGTNITSGRLNLSNVKYISEEKALELRRSMIKPGDIVIIAVGSSGKALQIPHSLKKAVMSQNFNKITPDISKATSTYLEFCFNSQLVQNQFTREMTDTVRTFLSLTKIKDVKIPLPPIEQQNQFAELVRDIEKQKALAQTSLQKSEDLFNSLLQRAFKGELFK